MEDGRLESTTARVDNAPNNLRALDAEVQAALGEKGVTDVGTKLKFTDANGETHQIDIDVTSNNGQRWVEVKNREPFGLESSDWKGKPGSSSASERGLKEQARLML